jgi:hypothetical protein
MFGFILIGMLLSSPVRGQEALPERVPLQTLTVSQQRVEPISAGMAGAFIEGVNIHDLGQLNTNRIVVADQAAADKFKDIHPGPQRVGLTRSVGTNPLSMRRGTALLTALPDGNTLWTLAIRSPGALGMRIHFSQFDVGNGSMIIYARSDGKLVTHGPYQGQRPPGRTGDFWSPSLPGDLVYVEITAAESPQVAIKEILHFDRDPGGADQGQNIQDLLPCQVDVMCFDFPPVHPFARDAVGRMIFIENGSAFVCTGTILTDLDNQTFVPLFLTAFHCISTQRVANTLEVVWLWQSMSCNGALPDFFSLPRSNGATLLETNPTDGGNDMSFFRLDGDLPGGVSLAGWTTASLPSSFVGIHHPGGDFKRATIMHQDKITACSGLGSSNYFYCIQDNGIIEGGSSGSGIFNSDGQLQGQLFGTCSSGGTGCDQRNEYNTVYGRFDVTLPIITRWLEIGGTINVDAGHSGEELGTPDKPFNTVQEANGFAWDGARIKIQAGAYSEALSFSKKLTVLARGGTVTIGL